MKKKLLLLFLLVTCSAFSQAPDLAVCDSNNDGFAAFNLNLQTPILLDGQSPADYTVGYFVTQTDAVTNADPIVQTANYTNIDPASQTIYARLTNNTDSTFTISTFQLIVNPTPVASSFPDVTVCDSYELPQLTNGESYQTGPNGTGTLIAPGTIITASQAIYVQNMNISGCSSYSDFMVTIVPAPIIPTPSDVVVCESYALPVLPIGNYYSQPGGTGSPIPYSTLITSTQTIYIYASSGFCSDEASFAVTISETPDSDLEGGTICKDFTTGNILQPVMLDAGMQNSSNYTYTWSLNGVVLPGAVGNTYIATQPGVYSVTITSAMPPFCTWTLSGTVMLSGPAVVDSVTVEDQTITVTVSGYSDVYNFLLDGAIPIIGNSSSAAIFTNIDLGTHTLEVLDANGCGTTMISNIEVATPYAPFGETTQTFNTGQTLADIIVTGQNIQWYANASPTGRMMVETPLPLTTLLVNGTTYYASQTINGIESTNRLAVTVTVGLGTQNNPFQHLSYYPNPVKNSLKIANAESIDSVSLSSVLGQVILSKTINNPVADIDLSELSNGIYFAKITAGGKHKTIRIIKE